MTVFNRVMLKLVVALACLYGLPAHAECPKLLDHTLPRLQDGAKQSLCDYQGKVILVVNTASLCGFTKQYEALESVYAKYKDRGLVVIGFPSNDFGEQEPGSDKEIAEFCRLTYGVKFPMMGKTDIVPPKTNSLYKELIKRTGSAPKWNFHKYLIDRSGEKVQSYESKTTPDSPAVVSQIERWLAEK